MNEPRNLKTSGPWCWQSKGARRRIRDAFDATGNVASALSIYDALTEIASNEQAETFRAAHAFVAGLAGVSAPTVKRVFPVLREIGLIHVETPALRAPSVVTLLAHGDPTLGNGDLTLAHGEPALAHGRKRGERSTSEESDEESSEEHQKGAPRRVRVKFKKPSVDEWTAFAGTIGFPPNPAANAYHHYASNGWRVGKNPMKDWQAACRTCHGRWKADDRTAGRGSTPQPQQALRDL